MSTPTDDTATKAPKPKKTKAPPQNLVVPPPRPQLSKAERRALQEQQRAAKAAATTGSSVGTSSGGSGGGNANKVTSSKVAQPPPISSNATQSSNHVRTDSKLTIPSVSSGTPMIHGNLDTMTYVSPHIEPRHTLVSHLAPYKDPTITFDTGAVLRPSLPPPPVTTTTGTTTITTASFNPSMDYMKTLHPAIIALGYQYATGTIRGGNARCRSMLECYSTVLQDLARSHNHSKEHNVDDNSKSNNNSRIIHHTAVMTSNDWRFTIENTILKPAFTYWTEHCRLHSVSMGNAFTFLKTAIHTLDRDIPLDEMIIALLETIDSYIHERIVYAKTAIAEIACTKLLFGQVGQLSSSKLDVILTYGYSEAVLAVLILAMKSRQKPLRIIVVDSSPLLEGRKLLQELQRESAHISSTKNRTADITYTPVEFTYVHLHAITYVLPTVSKVLLGAAALQCDGSVTGRVGTAMVALAAHMKNIPVLVCSETHKISNRGIPLESLTQNELFGSSATEADTAPKRIDLLYDLTPASYVSGIVTELGIVPPSSVAVLLREMNQPSGRSTSW
jgi:translation initiation factor eIF-2B subunit delta